MKRLQLPADHVITLAKNSIEDYLLVPRAILAAVPQLRANQAEIAQFIKSNSGRSAKKNLLDDMFRKYGNISYKEAIHAGQIANALAASEIDLDLCNIIEKLSGLSK